jgi:isochorismate synthase
MRPNWRGDPVTTEVEALFHAAVKGKLPIALWRLPFDARPKAVIDLSGKVFPRKLDLEESERGFAFSPFVSPNGRETLILHADLIFDAGLKELIETPSIRKDPRRVERQKRLMMRFESLIAHPAKNASSGHHLNVSPRTQSDKDHYCQLVSKGIQSIQKQRFKKLVLSRTKVVSLVEGVHPALLFQNLCHLYPEAFTSLVSIPNVGTWMGASPSILMKIDRDNILRTVALGGTQRVPSGGIGSGNSTWGKKEIAEQAFIARFMMDCFKRNDLKQFTKRGPITVRAGDLLHLETEFIIDLKKMRSPDLKGRMLGSLHPSPAVCGTPTDKAMRFIVENEGYDRQFYAGFLGPVHIEDESQLYVNLRCMQLYNKKAILYVGAGITEKSDPEKEWEETEEKCNTLLRAMVCNPNGFSDEMNQPSCIE